MNTQDLSGLQLMRAMVERKIPLPPIAETIPMFAGEASRGKMLLKVKPDARHFNSQGVVHGGFAATVLDTVLACAVHTMLGPNTGVCTIDLNVKFFKPLLCEKVFIAQANVMEMTRTLGFANAELRSESGTLHAQASASCMIMDNS